MNRKSDLSTDSSNRSSDPGLADLECGKDNQQDAGKDTGKDSTAEELSVTRSGVDGDEDSSGIVYESALESLPTTIGRYEIISQLGRGGFGYVYKAFDPELNCEVAIKVPRWDRLLCVGEAERFRREAQTLARMRNNSSIVTVYDVAKTAGDIPYAVMEFVDGESLSQYLAEQEVPIDEGLQILLRIAEALKAAHQASVIHRDLKPSNIILDSKKQITLVDFGLALHDDLSLGELGTAVEGTLLYMAPEQIRGENHRIDGQTDVWAFGVVMYRMLTRKHPFKAKTTADLTRAIGYKDAKPLRQLKPGIPKGIERICLKCLSKRMTDRYQSMTDLIDDLNQSIAEMNKPKSVVDEGTSGLQQLASEFNTGPVEAVGHSSGSVRSGDSQRSGRSTNSRLTGSGSSTDSSGNLRITYKGLRPFDSTDRDFFLRLLPGPRTRDDIPESIQFWNGRIAGDELEPLNVGIIYGPSGCGKSSFVRAGLLPALPARVNPVYLECTPEKTESRLVRQIAHRIHSVDENESLTEVLRQFRRGQHLADGDSLVIVLDQFEQWLFANQRYSEQELTNAIRQCDGTNIICLLLIRDDFWMSTSQFMKCLEIQIREGQNALALPMFDRRHARKVLVAFGRSFRRLPVATDDQGDSLESSQRKFIREAVDSLAQDGKVNCVHLSVFAKIAQDREWTASELHRLGGLKGVGVRFLGDLFGGKNSVRSTETKDKIVRTVFQQLLPASDMDIKGKSRTKAQLKEAIPGNFTDVEFQETLERLNADLSLISYVETIGDDDAEVDNSSSGSLRLTHDFLVAPIREWLDLRQQETPAGRSQSRLVSLGEAWNVSKDNRFLPSLSEYVGFSRFASSQHRSDYAGFLGLAKRKMGVRMAVIAATLATILVVGFTFENARRKSQAGTMVQSYRLATASEAPSLATQLVTSKSHARPALIEGLDSDSATERLRCSSFLLLNYPFEDRFADEFTEAVKLVSTSEFPTAVKTFEILDEARVRNLEQWARQVPEIENRVKFAILLLDCGFGNNAVTVLARAESHSRSLFIQDYVRTSVDPFSVVERIDENSDQDFRSGLYLALAYGIKDGLIDSTGQEKLVRMINDTSAPNVVSAGTKASLEFLMAAVNAQVSTLKRHAKTKNGWQTIELAGTELTTFVRVPGGNTTANHSLEKKMIERLRIDESLELFDHEVLVKDFYLAQVPVSNLVFDKFVQQLPADHRLHRRKGFGISDSQLPATGMLRNEAIEFINWLNVQHGLPEYYVWQEIPDEIQKQFDGFVSTTHVWVARDKDAVGFRLPTVSEWQYAYRSGSNSVSPYSDSLEMPFWGMFTWFREMPPGMAELGRPLEKMPNPFGLHDMSGNTCQWCTNDVVDGIEHYFYDFLQGGGIQCADKFMLSGIFGSRTADGKDLVGNESIRLAVMPGKDGYFPVPQKK